MDNFMFMCIAAVFAILSVANLILTLREKKGAKDASP